VARAPGPYFERPPKITVSYTQSCNLSCKHCYADCTRTPSPRELGREEWLRFIDYLVANDFIQVYFEGGEPLQRADFREVLRYCGRRLMTWVRTNGTLVTAVTAREFRRFGVGTVLVDVMGAHAKTHDWFTGAPGSFKKACTAVKHFLDVGIPTYMLIILNRRNAAEINEYLELAARLGAPKVGILRLYPIGRAKRRWDELSMSLEDQTKVIAGLRVPDGLRIMQSWHPRDHNCCWQGAAVNAYGDSIGCVYLREYVRYGNIREMPFLETWKHPLYQQLRSGRVKESCSGCHSTQGTHGGCRSTAYAFHGRWDAPDPFCTTLNHGVDLRELPERLLQKDAGSTDPAGA